MATRKLKKTPAKHRRPNFLVPDGAQRSIEPHRLLLDPENLRILEFADPKLLNTPVHLIGEPAIQNALLDTICSVPQFEIQGLVESITSNGFLKHENLIVSAYDSGQFLVLEGNRRLAAVRQILLTFGNELKDLPLHVRKSLATLPCFLLQGPPIESSKDRLNEYRRSSEIYVGLRHLMGAKSWEPASRYEFQARLFDEGWSVEDVSKHFGRKKSDVLRDLKAQRLYRDFIAWERKSKSHHSITYNAFAEAARAPAIMKWIGWSDETMRITDLERRDAFFEYLIHYIHIIPSQQFEEGEELTTEESAEAIVRGLRDILKLSDRDIDECLIDKDFETANNLYQERKEGDFAKRLRSYIRGIRNVTSAELSENAVENTKRLKELIKQAENTLRLLRGSTGSDS